MLFKMITKMIIKKKTQRNKFFMIRNNVRIKHLIWLNVFFTWLVLYLHIEAPDLQLYVSKIHWKSNKKPIDVNKKPWIYNYIADYKTAWIFDIAIEMERYIE